jgi:DNA-binding CsgD family transcriptional regulator
MNSRAAALRFDDFLTDLQGAGSVPDAQAVLQKTVEKLGFKTYDYATGLTTPRPVTAMDVAIDCYLSTVGWSDRYITEGFPAHDRFTRTALSRVSPFAYDLLLGRPPETAKQRQMEGEIGEQGIKSGVVVPVHSSSNRYGVLHFGAEMKPQEFARLDRETRPIAALIATYFHEHMMGLLAPAPQRPVLSPREEECLRWAALGKTSWEMSEILGIAERTVKKHVGSAMLKLGVTTRTQAVAKAIAQGLIRP